MDAVQPMLQKTELYYI